MDNIDATNHDAENRVSEERKRIAYAAGYGVGYGLVKQLGLRLDKEGIEEWIELMNAMRDGGNQAREEAWDAHMQQLEGH